MLAFMDYVQEAFAQSTGWKRDNSYAALTSSSRHILDFDQPRSLRVFLSSLASPNFASSYSVGSDGLLDGSISYMYTSRELSNLQTASSRLAFRDVVPSYRQLESLKPSDPFTSWEVWHQGKRIDRRDSLFYGRLYLPTSVLEALYVRRLSPATQLTVSAISGSRLPYGETVLAHLEHDTARYRGEFLFSTDSALCGFQALYNFGPDASLDFSHETAASGVKIRDPRKEQHGRFSAGGEIYYGLSNKSGGLSAGLRFATLPTYPGFPYTMTLTLNPLMGCLSSTYTVLASPMCALSTRFNFNFYSYESDLRVGTQLWRPKQPQEPDKGLDWAKQKMFGPQSLEPPSNLTKDVAGCLKANVDQRGSISLLWESRFKELLYSAGFKIDVKGGANMFESFGLEIHYSP